MNMVEPVSLRQNEAYLGICPRVVSLELVFFNFVELLYPSQEQKSLLKD